MSTRQRKSKSPKSLRPQGKARKAVNRGSSPNGRTNAASPELRDLTSKRTKIKARREVRLSDLIRRKAVRAELDGVRKVVAGKVVLVTGAAGSIGSELCRQILKYGPTKLVCLDRNENGLFHLQMDLRERQGSTAIAYCVEDFAHSDAMRCIFSAHRIQIVFHAAGYKHVPMMERNPQAAIENNVFGLVRLLDVCEASRCETFVLISSDKAVNPTSVMGCTKRLGELILACRKGGGLRCVSVRFGNVLGSQGSVVPVFQKQIAENKPLTVTHEDITRFFITVGEAVSLLLQASAIAKNGEILALEMGEPIRILDLARALIRSSGKTEKDVEIIFPGLRPGEKLHEELFYEDEQVFLTSCDGIKRTSRTILSWPDLKSWLDALRLLLYTADDDKLRTQIQRIIPEYRFESIHATTPVSAVAASRAPLYMPGSQSVRPQNLIAQMAATDADASSPGSS
jgi:FlaA1/EpsC-like NDP-sugar epimerase